MKRFRSLLTLLLVASMVLTFAAQVSTAKAQKATITFWNGFTGPDRPAVEALVKKFNDTHPNIEVKMEITPWDSLMQNLLSTMSAGQGPDVVGIHFQYLPQYAKSGYVMDLTDQYKAGTNLDPAHFPPALVELMKHEGKFYAAPMNYATLMMYYNKDLFKAAGLDPEKPPSTMEELVEFAEKLTIVGADGKLEQVGFIPDHSWSHTDLYVRNFGGFWYSDDGSKLTVNSQPMIDALTWQQQFYTKYGVTNLQAFSSGFGEYGSPDAPFYAGKVAMMVEGEWQVGPNFIPALKPELNYGVTAFPPPAAHPERKGTIVNQGTVVVVPSGAADKDASARLLAWMMSPAIVAEEFCFNANLPTSKKAAEDPCFSALGPKFQVFIDLMESPNAYAVITTPFSLELNDALGSAEEEILYTGADPKATLDKVQADLEQKFNEMMSK